MKTASPAWCSAVLGLAMVVGCGDDGVAGSGGGPSTSAGAGGATTAGEGGAPATTTSGDGGAAPAGPGPGGAGGGEPEGCSDGVTGGDETDVDCGGSCPPCGNGLGCATGDDCISAVCGPTGTCSAPSCGDGVTNGADECDGGAVDDATCDADCTVAQCGDTYANAAAGEACDDGAATASCDADCTEPVCGDGTLNLAAGEECDDGGTATGDGCDAGCAIEPPGDCGVLLAMAPLSESGVHTIGPEGVAPFDAYCEMALDGGGWTLVMNVNTANGQLSTLAAPIWTATTEVASFADRWASDYKSLAAEVVIGDQLLVVVRDATAPEGAAPRGWRSWNLDGAKTWNSFFAVAMGDASANATGGCNTGHSGDGRRQTTGILSPGVAAPYDTFTGFAADVYSNSYYGGCAAAQDGFRLSSWYRWSNNSNVGLGLQMDSDSSGIYSLEAGSHMLIDTFPNPQRFCSAADCSACTGFPDGGVGPSSSTLAAIGTDHYDYHCTVGESYRYEWYVR